MYGRELLSRHQRLVNQDVYEKLGNETYLELRKYVEKQRAKEPSAGGSFSARTVNSAIRTLRNGKYYEKDVLILLFDLIDHTDFTKVRQLRIAVFALRFIADIVRVEGPGFLVGTYYSDYANRVPENILRIAEAIGLGQGTSDQSGFFHLEFYSVSETARRVLAGSWYADSTSSKHPLVSLSQ